MRRGTALILRRVTGVGLLLSAIVVAGTAPAAAQVPLPITTTTPAPSPAPSAPPPAVAPPPVGDTTTALGADGSRRSTVTGAGLSVPLALRWRADLAGMIWGPVAGGGHVFVSVSRPSGYGADVVALDAATGARQWDVPIEEPYFAVGLTYADGTVFAADQNHIVHALDASTGVQRWTSEALPDIYSNSAPLAEAGLVYVQGEGVYALDAKTGSLVWHSQMSDGSQGDPAVAGDRVYMAGGCTVAALDRRSGATIWKQNSGCSGGGGGRVIVDRDTVYPHGTQPRGPYASSDGHAVNGIDPNEIAGSIGLLDAPLGAVDVLSGRTLWSKPTAHATDVEPLVAGGLLIRSGAGQVEIRDTGSGALRQASILPAPATHGDQGVGGLRPAIAAMPGLVVVPSSSTLYALGPGRGAPLVLTTRDTATAAGRKVRLSARANDALIPMHVVVQESRFPFANRFRRVGSLVPANAFTHGFETDRRVDRDMRLRIADPTGATRPSRAITVFVFPRVTYRITRSGNAIRAHLTVTVAREVRARGRSVVLYLDRVARHRLERLGRARLHGPARRIGRATISFAAPTGVGPRDGLLACVPRIERAGMGYTDRIQRGCGRRSIRY